MHARFASRGVSLVEAMIALLVLGFGLAAIAGFQLGLSRHADVARQRSEATRLAQEKIESWRAFAQIASGGATAYQDLGSGSDAPALASNAAYARSWTVASDARDLRRLVAVDVAWSDRAGETAHVVLRSIVSRSDPLDGGSLAVPTTANSAMRRTHERSIHIPFDARQLGGANRGRSTLAWGGASGGYLVFDDTSGAVAASCAAPVDDATSIATSCAMLAGYLLQGYIGGAPTGAALALVFDQSQYLSATPECSLQAATDQNNGATITGLLRYRCLMRPSDHDSNAATAPVWSGRLRIAGLPQGSVACRYQPQPETYTLVAMSLEQQNYLIGASCPSGTSLQPSG
jgi:Tfp pilus assembly protein PilV